MALVAQLRGASLIEAAQLNDPDARSVVIGSGSSRLDILVINQNGQVHAFVNACPHAGTPLENFDGRVLDRDDPNILVCSTHGARFRLDDGCCIKGPCLGKKLPAVATHVANGMVVLGSA